MEALRDEVIPIEQLFFTDAGPHVLSAGSAHDSPASAEPTEGPGSAPVPIETLLYGGRAALDRALEIRNEVRATGIAPPREVVDELLDLVALAATE